MSNKRFNLLEDIKSNEIYKKRNRDEKARKIIESTVKSSRKTKIFPGQLILFKYYDPKTKEDLEYYDASPCTIFFGIFNSSQGKRVLGFNIHYFPPSIRYRLMNKIYELYRPIYTKYFETGLDKELDAFDYRYLINELNKYNLDFAVRMYIPQLIGDVKVITPNMWSTAVFTEGWFKKETRARIMNMFKNHSTERNKHFLNKILKKNKNQDKKL